MAVSQLPGAPQSLLAPRSDQTRFADVVTPAKAKVQSGMDSHFRGNDKTGHFRPSGTTDVPVRLQHNKPSGLVFNIMRFSIHDGPGIRTTVFMKGCPLRCAWCHNPESQSSRPELLYFEETCIRCSDCVRACPEGALRIEEKTVIPAKAGIHSGLDPRFRGGDNFVVCDPALCRQRGECVEACSAGARDLAGQWMTVAEVVAEVMKDRVFFEESGGGVTVSGGEPLMQAEFVEHLLGACRERGILTTLDTCGYAPTQVLGRISKFVDLVLYDLKLMDREKHQRFTGVKNDLILKNLGTLAELGSRVTVRIPVIPGVNDAEEDLAAFSAFLTELGLHEIDLLPYHRIGTGKYQRLQRTNHLGEFSPPSAEHMAGIAARLRRDGFRVHVGG